ncbi:MAG: chorismate mutase [Bacteroidia bacterium]|nr:chorismate mutase [Bacteroidia bacterium]
MNGSGLVPVTSWFPGFSDKPLIIAGPCSAETEEQVYRTAEGISQIGRVKIFRAGIWKPRTRPHSFEGVGVKGLHWLKRIKEDFGFYTLVEVAYPKHVESCLHHKVDMVWIGARTTSNPFSVEELANALKGTDLPVLIKNPINPDLDLWIGGIERLRKNGITKLAAVHRGFYPFEKTALRNIPKWELVIELKRRIHDLPVITDPSHIAGNTKYIGSISQKALDLEMDGLMIECHINPPSALSDADQQLTPAELGLLLDNLTYREVSDYSPRRMGQLERFREQIDSIDNQLIELLSQRMNVIDKIGRYKSHNNITILQLRRWENIIATRTELGHDLGLSEQFILRILQLIHKESIQRQVEIMNRLKNKNFNPGEE